MDLKPCIVSVYMCMSNYMACGSLYFEIVANSIVVQPKDVLIFLAIGLQRNKDEIEMNNSSLKHHILCWFYCDTTK